MMPCFESVTRNLPILVTSLLFSGFAAAANPAPSQLYYVPFPESDQLSAFAGVNAAAVDPLNIFVTFSAASDNTVIYYDHWEDGYESDISAPKQSTTQVFGDGNPANGYPPGNAADLIPSGTVFSLRNYVNSTAGSSVIKFDGRDKIASFKPISVTKTSYPAVTNSLFAGSTEVLERGLWGTEYRVPVGVDMPTTTATSTLTWDADSFGYTSLSIMAGSGGATVQIDADNNGAFEQTVTIAEGNTIYVPSANVGGRVVSDRPVQVLMFSGRITSTYQSRTGSLIPTNRWSSNYYAPVSTSAANASTVFLYNPGASAITVSYDYRSSATAYTTATVSVPAGGNARVNLAPANGTNHFGAYRFYTTGVSPATFYAFCAVDCGSTSLASNQAYDGGFTLVGQPSLTTQILVGLGIGRDPTSATNLAENGNPIWITTVGNGNTPAAVYVDYKGDNAGLLTDPNGNRYDLLLNLRELEQAKVFDPSGDQSGMLAYVLAPGVKVTGAWAQDPTAAAAAQPGLDVATLVPPLREGDGAKGSTVALDADGDGFRSAGDTLEYDIRTVNTARTDIAGPFTVKDNLPTTVNYVPGSTRFRYSVGGAWQAWTSIPDDLSGTAFPLDGVGYGVPGTLRIGQQIQVTFRAAIKSYANLPSGTKEVTNTGSIIVTPFGVTIELALSDPLFGSIGDRVWTDTNGNGLQDSGETGLNNATVYLDLNGNGSLDSGEPRQVTSGDGSYTFNGLLAGTYQVRVDPVSVSAINPGYGPTFDLDGIATSYGASVLLASAQDRVDADFGFRIGASVGDRVWMDRNGDGIQGLGEPGIGGVRVFIDSNGNGTFNTGEPNSITNGDGTYFIGNLSPGTYTVRVDTGTLPAGASQTYDLDTVLNHSTSVVLTSALHRGDVDFGYQGNQSIGDLVWDDRDGDATRFTYNIYNGRVDLTGDGSADGSDDGFIGTLQIIDGNLDTNGDGSINASDGGTYQGFAVFSGRLDTNNSGAANNQDDLPAGIFNEAGLANVRVYLDINGNGVFETSEPSAVTNAVGAYTIGNLFNGSYTVRVDPATLPASYVGTYDLTSPVDDHAATVLLSGTSRTDVDFGYRRDASIGDRVWNDRNSNGVVDAGEPGIEGVLIYIDANDNGIFERSTERFAVTDVNGYYTINNLPAGTFLVRAELSTLPQGATQTYDLDGTGTANRATRTLALSETALDVDFGYSSSASFGDLVWNDANANGIKDGSETGLSGVRVYVDINGNGIYDSASEPSALTASDGSYTIGNLVPGIYTARVDTTTLPASLVQTFDPEGAFDHAATFSLTANQLRTEIDFGYTARATVGNFVWNDTNANGRQDGGEAGIQNVTVTAFNAANDTIVGTAVTNSSGIYSFPSLMPGTYYLVFDRPSGYQATLADLGNDTGDSDANTLTGRTPNFTLTGGQTNNTLDAGFYQPVSIGDRVFNDVNANGIQDGGETGLAGVIVSIYQPGFGPDGIAGNADDALAVATQTTPAGGAYDFTGLRPGTYQVGFGSLVGYNRTPANQGADDAVDSDADATTGLTGNYVMAAGSSNTTIDAGYYQPGAITGTVFADTDNNNSGDVAMPGVILTLKDSAGNDIDSDPVLSGIQATTAVTNGSGVYTFSNLIPGSYRVVQTQPSGYLSVSDVDGANNNVIGDEAPILVAAGLTVTQRSFVEEQLGTVFGHLYIDTNGNGSQDSGEPDLADVTVLVTGSDSVVRSVSTNGSGDWSVILPPGSATADVDETDPQYPSGYPQTEGNDPTTVTAVSGFSTDAGNDGYFLPGSITGVVLADTNNDNSGDIAISGVTLTLLNAGGSPVDGDPVTPGVQPVTTVTAGDGGYSFGGLPPGTYGVRETQPSGYDSVLDSDGGDPDEILPVVVSAGVTNSGNDFLEEQPGSISGTVFVDTDDDGDADTTLGGVLIRLLDATGNPVLDGLGDPITILTLPDGRYGFGGLSPGNYRVSQDQPSNYGSVSDTDGPNDNVIGNLVPVLVTSGNNNGGNDFIEIELGVINGYVGSDTDQNGSGETPLPGVIMNLLDDSGNPVLDGLGAAIQAVTNTTGFYTFTLVPTGSYRVLQSQPSGYASVSDVDGANNNLIGDETPIDMTPGLVVNGRDFVEIEFGAISGRVFKDTNDDGNGDTFFPGVTLTLLDASGNPVDGDPLTGGVQPVTAVTGIDGSYRFENLYPDDYQVSETQPAGYFSVSDVDGGNLDLIGNITAITVNPGQEVTGRDFTEIELGAISGYVYVGSVPLSGVTLTLLDEFGNPVDGDPVTPGVQPITATTNGSGYYSFPGVVPGVYQIGQAQPYGYESLGDIDGGDVNIIGDVSPVNIAPGQISENNDFIETVDTCPDDWDQWKYQHPTEIPAGNPDADAYDNFAEFAFAMPFDKGTGSPWLGSTAWVIQPSSTIPGTLEGVFVRPKGALLNVTYSLQYAATPGNPINWQSILITPSMYDAPVDNGDCTETVTIRDLELLTGLTGGRGFVRIQADLDDDGGGNGDVDHTSHTETEGWTVTDLEVCCRTYNNPYQHETAFTGTVTGVSGQILTFAAGDDLGTLLAAGGSYYLEVTSGANEGHRFDIVSTTGNTVTVAVDNDLHSVLAPFNTITGAAPVNLGPVLPGKLVGDQVAIHRHRTLDEVFPPLGFGATGSQSDADQIQIFAGGAWAIYWLYDDGDADPATARWVDAADSGMADKGTAIIPPGQGMFFNNRNNMTSILAYGEIRQNDFIRPHAAGSNLVGGGYPVDQSANGSEGRAMSMATGFFASRDFKTADSIFVWKADTTIDAVGYDTYFLLGNVSSQPSLTRWVKVGDASILSRDPAILLLGNRSVFTRTTAELPGYKSPCPWAP